MAHTRASSPGRARHGLAISAALVAISAFGGAAGLVTGSLSVGADLEQRLPLASPVLGGVALGLIVGVPFSVLAVLAWRGDEQTDLVSLCVGGLLIGWLVVELAFIRTFSFFHPTFGLIGAAFMYAGRRAWPGLRL